MPSEPVRTPVTALSRVIAQAAKTESNAAELFSAVTRWASSFWVAIVNRPLSAASEYNWSAGSGKQTQEQRKPGPAKNSHSGRSIEVERLPVGFDRISLLLPAAKS